MQATGAEETRQALDQKRVSKPTVHFDCGAKASLAVSEAGTAGAPRPTPGAAPPKSEEDIDGLNCRFRHWAADFT